MPRIASLAPLALLVLLAGCAPGASIPVAGSEEISARLAAINTAVESWRNADDLATAHRFAEEARNLVVGPNGPGYGDVDDDGSVEGATDVGLLPGLDGEPGLATDVDGVCIERDVLGGDWSDAANRWRILETAIADWAPGNNTFPSLPSHPQRVVGWATLTLASTDLDDAREFAGHAALHVDVSVAAVERCTG